MAVMGFSISRAPPWSTGRRSSKARATTPTLSAKPTDSHSPTPWWSTTSRRPDPNAVIRGRVASAARPFVCLGGGVAGDLAVGEELLHLADRVRLDLAGALARDAEVVADLLQRERLVAH